MTALPFILLSGLFPAVVIVAAMRDVTTFTIPNWLSVLAAIGFFPAAFLAHLSVAAFGVSVGVGALALVLGMMMFALGWIGGGDAKLFAACALWLGWPAVLPFILWTSIAGGGLAVTLLWSRKLAVHYPGLGPPWFGRLMQSGGDVPYGLAIAIGALIAFPSSVLVHPLL